MRAVIPCLFSLVASALAADAPQPPIKAPWSSFRGNSSQTGRREGPLSDAPRLSWTFDAKSEVQSTAAIVDGKVFVGSELGLHCLELGAADKGGKELWRFKTESKVQSSPAVRDGKVYFGDDGGIFHVVDAATGKEVWKFDTKTEDGGGQEIISSANFSGDRVLFGAYDSNLYCLSCADGSRAWKVQTQGPVHSSPAIIDGKTFIAGCDERLRTIDVATGSEVSSLELGGYSAASPSVIREKLIVGTFNMQVLCVDWKESKVLWRYENPDRQFPFYSSAAIGSIARRTGDTEEPVAVLGGRDKVVHAIRIADGKALWTFPTKARVDVSPVIVGNRVIVGSLDGDLHILDLQTGASIWKFTAGQGFSASPAVGEERLVIGGVDGQVYCFDLKPNP